MAMSFWDISTVCITKIVRISGFALRFKNEFLNSGKKKKKIQKTFLHLCIDF